MPNVLRPAGLEPVYALSQVWLDFEDSFRTDNLVWGQEPERWKSRLLTAFASMCPEPCTAHDEGHGDRWLFDMVWSVGDPPHGQVP